MARLLPCAALLLLLCACDSPQPEGAAPSASAPAASATAADPPQELPAPEPLDVEALKKSLRCGKGGHGPCEVLQEFNDCQPFDPVTQSGDGRWLGQSYVVKRSAFIEDFAIMRSRRVPLSEVGPGQLGAKIAVERIPDDRVAETRHAGKAVRAFARGDSTKQTNAAIDYIKQREEWQEAFTMKAKDNQVYIAARGGGFLCAKDKQRLLLVQKSGDREHPADGVYAVLWPVSW